MHSLFKVSYIINEQTLGVTVSLGIPVDPKYGFIVRHFISHGDQERN